MLSECGLLVILIPITVISSIIMSILLSTSTLSSGFCDPILASCFLTDVSSYVLSPNNLSPHRSLPTSILPIKCPQLPLGPPHLGLPASAWSAPAHLSPLSPFLGSAAGALTSQYLFLSQDLCTWPILSWPTLLLKPWVSVQKVGR